MRAFSWHDGPISKKQAKRRRHGIRTCEALESRALMTVSVTSVALMSDTGASGSDKITQTPTITGTTTGSPPYYGWAEIQFDHHSDGNVEGSSTVSNGSFSYNPINVDAALSYWEGALPLKYRVVEHNSNGSIVSTGAWSSFNIVLDRIGPTSTGFSTLMVDEDSADSQIDLGGVFADGYTSDANLQYQVIANSNSSLFDAVSISGGTITLNYAANRHGSASITVRCTDQAGNTRDSFLYATVASVNDPPVIVSFLVVENGEYTWNLSGVVTDDGSLTACRVHFGGVFASLNLWANVGTNGTFTIIVEYSGTFYGSATAIAYDADDAASNEAVYLMAG